MIEVRSAVVSLLLASALGAQSPFVLGNVYGAASPEGLGSQNALTGLGDIDGDGVPDFVAGAYNWPMPIPGMPGQTIAQVGKARVYSGATLTQIFEVTGTYNLQALGKSVANVGDLDGDGRNDFAVGAPMYGPIVPGGTPPPPQVQVWSSGTHALLYTITSGTGGFASANFGVSIAGIGDVNGDGISDILVGASAGNAAAVYSGANGGLLFSMSAATLNPPAPAPPLIGTADDFGGTVAATGDVTGDGVPDLLVCARLSALGGSSGGVNSGAVFLLSGAGGGLIQVFTGGPGDAFGNCAASIGDVNGDGVPDFAIGATRTDVGGTDTGSITMVSGATRLPLWTTNGLVANDWFGYAVAAAGDVNHDGIPDVLVGSPVTDLGATNTGSATLLDGATGQRLGSINGLLTADLLGRAVAGFGDFDGDGTPDVLVAAPAADVGGSSTGTVSIVSFGPWLRPSAAGAIPQAGGGAFDMIKVNATNGGPPRRVDLAAFQAFTVSFTQPPTFAPPAPLYSFGMIGVPGAADQFLFPLLGTMCFAPPLLNPYDPRLFLATDSFVGLDPAALIPSSPQGSWSVPVPGGLPAPFRVALSGVRWNGAAYFRTNAILIDVR